MRFITLNSDWELSFTHPMTKKIHAIPATVPGNIAADLMRADIIPDLYTGENVLAAQQWERVDFTFATSFASPMLHEGERLEINFEGVDTIASVRVNGKQAAFLENMFIPHAVDITPYLSENGKNTLVVTVHNVIDYSAGRAKRWGIDGFEFSHLAFYEAIFVRKAQHMFGWDIAPRILFGGLWRPVTLQVHSQSEILPQDLYFAARSIDAEKSQAAVEIAYGLSLDPKTNWYDYELHIDGSCGESSFSRTVPLRFTHGKECFTVSNAKLWWPSGYGEPHLYDLSIALFYQGEKVDDYHTRVGIRTVALDFHADSSHAANNRFQIIVNGIGIFAKGSNWVPADALHACDQRRIHDMLSMWVDTHCNIVRCWGGNVYEDHAFFDFCDEHGLMVWQDFMFGCARYPHNEEFLDQVRGEAKTIIRRLRNHASIVLWAGDNEIDSSFTWANPGYTPPSQNHISRVILKEAVAFHDPFKPYLPSSPFVSDEMHVTHRHDATPEQHLWGPRGYFKADFYAKNTALFASEIGYHGMPSKKSMECFLSKDKIWGSFNNNEWILHAANFNELEDSPMGRRNYFMLDQVKHLFGESVNVDDMDDFILASQITQAEAKKYFIEHFRSRKPPQGDIRGGHKTGIIWWNMIDCWPQFSDAIVDYYYDKKLAYDYIKRAQAPVCIMVAEDDNAREIVAVNDTLSAMHGEWKITADNRATVRNGSFDIPPNGRVRLDSLEKSSVPVFYAIEWAAGGKVWQNHYVESAAPWDFSWYRERMKTLMRTSPPVQNIASAAFDR